MHGTRFMIKKEEAKKKINIDKIKDTDRYVDELIRTVNSKIEMIKTFCSKLDSVRSDTKDKINNKESLDEITAYLESYKKKIKNIRLPE